MSSMRVAPRIDRERSFPSERTAFEDGRAFVWADVMQRVPGIPRQDSISLAGKRSTAANRSGAQFARRTVDIRERKSRASVSASIALEYRFESV
jgi:hypothetical protein